MAGLGGFVLLGTSQLHCPDFIKWPTYREIDVDRFYPSAYFPNLPIVR